MSYDDSKAALIGAFNTAPPYIQNFISSGKYAQFMEQLRTRFNLHADIVSDVSNEITMTMLGLIEPQELPGNLKTEAKVPEELIKPIVEEVNRAVFLPLQEELRKNPDALKKPVAKEKPKEQWVQITPVPQASSAAPRPLAQTPIYTPPVPPPSVSAFNQPVPAANTFVPQAPPNVVLPGSTPPVPTPTPVALPPQPNFQPQPVEFQQPQAQPAYVPPPAPPQQYVPPQPPQYAPPAPAPMQQAPQSYAGEAVAMVRTMSADMEAAKRGQQAEPHFISIPHPAQAATPQAQPQYAPAPQQQAAPMQQPQYAPQQTVSPQWSTPGPSAVPAPRPAPVAQPKPQYIRPYVPPTPRVAPRAAAVPGSGDPYREPVE